MNRTKTFLYFTVFMIALFLLGEFIVGLFFPEYTSAARYIIPVIYWLLYSAFILVVKFPSGGADMAKYFMAFKGGKLFLSLMMLVVLGFAFREQAVGVIINFLVYSTLLLIAETATMLYLKKHYN